MSAYGHVRRLLGIVGSRWGFVPVAIIALFAYGAQGRPTDALPFLFVWALVVGACSWLAKLLPAPGPPALPGNRPVPPAALAVAIGPLAPAEASPDLATMKARLPAHVGRLLR